MKKLLKVIFIVLANISLNAQTKTAIVTYKKVKVKKTVTEDKRESLGEKNFKRFSILENETNKTLKNLSFTLNYNKNQALFKVNDFMDTPNNRFAELALLPYGSGTYYNSKTERIKLMESFGEYFRIYYPKDFTKWSLLSETKKIGKYTSYKAVATEKVSTSKGFLEYKITAWYTPEITVQYGPIGYAGLPGLILELEKNNYLYYVTNIELNPKKEVKVKQPTKGKKISQKKYRELILEAMGKFRKIRG